MKIIFKIARAELKSLFYSPVAWFVLLVFYLFGAISFMLAIEKFSKVQEVFLDSNPDWFGFDAGIGTYVFKGVMGLLLQNLYFFIPLLTMGVINREINSGTIKLLYSSPLRSREIVIGKYLGLLVFNALLVTLIAILLFTGYLTVQDAEFNWYFSMLLGTFLLINAFSAIGMFISSLTNYQLVAAVLTFALFFLLERMSGWGQRYDIIRDITYFLSMSRKVGPMIMGLISTRDVAYFILIILLFIGFTIIKLKSTQESKHWSVSFSRYLGLLMIVIFIGYFTSIPGKVGYWDLTDSKKNTLHPNTQAVLKELDGSKLTVTLYTNLFSKGTNARRTLPEARNEYLWQVWEPYLRFYPNIEFKYEYFYDVKAGDSTIFRTYPGKTLNEIVDLETEVFGVSPDLFQSPEAIREKIDLTNEFHLPVMVLEYKGRKAFLRNYGDATFWPDEPHFSATFKRLVREKEPRMLFVTGHQEREIYSRTERSYAANVTDKMNRRSLLNYGVDADTINLLHQNIPEDLSGLVVADPKSELQQIEKEKITAYLNKGGDAIILGEPGKQHILQPIANSIGVTLESGTIVKPNAHDLPHKFSVPLTKEGNELADEFTLERFRKYGISGGGANVFGAFPLEFDSLHGFKTDPVVLLKGGKDTWVENGKLVVDSAAPTFSITEGDFQKDNYVTAIKMTRRVNHNDQRIIVSGDADLLSTGRKNGLMGVALYSYALHNEYPKYANFPPAPDRYISIKSSTAELLKYVYIYIFSGIILSVAILLIVRRRRK